jgi:glycosyltransferase involved in cell wall biosynthesis
MRLGGTELNAVRTAERLSRERVELRVVCLSEDGPLTERYQSIGVPVVNFPISSLYGTSMLRSGVRFARYLQEVRAEIVHSHDVYSNIFVATWARFGGVRTIIASRRWWNSLPNWKLRLGTRFAFFRADAVLANSPQVAQTVIRDGVASSKIRTISNFVDDDAFEQITEPERSRRRERWGAPLRAVVIGCVARFDPVKDHAGLVRAFAMLRTRHPDVFLVLTGDGETRVKVESLVKELGVADAVHFTGELRGHDLHQGFDISALASMSEGFPNTLIEAMAAGNPVVATAVGGTVDAVAENETGMLVPPGEPVAMAAAMMRLVEDAQLRVRLGMEGRRRAMERYTADQVIRAVQAMYEQALRPKM